MRDFIILTDSCADLTEEQYRERGIRTVELGVILEGAEPIPNCDVDVKDFYAKQRNKIGTTTSAASIEQFITVVDEILSKNDVDLLYLGFSSALSGTFNAGAVALRELSEKYPDRKLYAVDTLCASLGQGLLVHLACQKKQSGADIDAVKAYVEETIPHLCHWFTVDDLFFLKRGGRVSAATAVVGSLLSIKPVLHVDNAGKLINVTKARGRRASIDTLFEKMRATILPDVNDVIYICHGDCIEDAEYLAGRVRNELGIKDVMIGYTGPVIGSHSGPGTLAIFYLGNER